MYLFNPKLESKLKKEFAIDNDCKLKCGIFENYLMLKKENEKIMLIHQFSKKRTEWENSFKLLDRYVLAKSKESNRSSIIFKRLYLLSLSKKTTYYLEIKINKKMIICKKLSGEIVYLDLCLNKVR